tara:strand:+ start:604 stop:759 length:156 start_codon:yes stop_codon:yes gene_type:complete
MKKTDEAEFYIKDNKTDIIEVYFTREELIEHLSSLVLIYNKDVYLKADKEK